MLELFYKVNQKVTVKVDGNNPQEVFQNLAIMQGVFSIEKCGCCGSDDLKYVARKAQGQKNKVYEYLELRCGKCGAKLDFGISEDGVIYPKVKITQLAVDKSDSAKKRAEENEKYAKEHYGMLMNNGWYKFKFEKKDEQLAS